MILQLALPGLEIATPDDRERGRFEAEHVRRLLSKYEYLCQQPDATDEDRGMRVRLAGRLGELEVSS